MKWLVVALLIFVAAFISCKGSSNNIEPGVFSPGQIQDANELVKALLPKYEETIDDAPSGCRYQDCHDMDTGDPSAEYVELYGEVKSELADMGIAFKS